MFYEPRIRWFTQQREFLRQLRQDEFYCKNNLKNISKRRKLNDPITDAANLVRDDSFPGVSTQEFMSTVMELSNDCQSTQLTESSLPWVNRTDYIVEKL